MTRTGPTAVAVNLVLVGCLTVQAVSAQVRVPEIGYVCPAGGQVGTTLQVTVGGQNLMGANAAWVTGEGVSARVIEYVRPLGNKQLGDVAQHLRVLIRKKMAETQGRRALPQRGDEELPPLPDHPLLRDLESKSLEELQQLRQILFDPKRQPNAQIAESVIVELTIAATAPPGDRELRLGTPLGLSNPLCLQIGRMPEVREHWAGGGEKPGSAPLTLPAIINGQIWPGEVDRYHLQVRGGQCLVIAAHARSLIPYLADAVPGWFQAVLTLRDPAGREVAYADDYRFHPDPVVVYQVPRDEVFLLEIRDALYRGREDFVYRIAAGEQPFVSSIFPLGGKSGAAVEASILGWNLPWQQVQLDTSGVSPSIRQVRWQVGQWLTNPVQYRVDSLPETTEIEPNNTPETAQRVELPTIVNGRIGAPGDVDLLSFQGKAGSSVVVEVQARRLGSPLDSLVRLVDSLGGVVAWNDDFMEKDGDLYTGPGLLTHHADSYLLATLPADGIYRVRLSDAQGQGSQAHGYRLRISPPQPDFSVCVTPSSLSLIATRCAPLTVHATRRDGFAGPIEVSLKRAPPGFVLAGAVIPPGRRSVHATISASERSPREPVTLELEARAQVNGLEVAHSVTAAEDRMQAFLWRHLVPCQALVALTLEPRRLAPTLAWAVAGPVSVPAGGSVSLPVAMTTRGQGQMPVLLSLYDPPRGLSMQTTAQNDGGMTVVLHADTELAGYKDNLIVEAAAEFGLRQGEGRPARRQRVWLGTLPALAIEVTPP